MYLEQLSIHNFKSFVGKNKVTLKSYTAVMFACERGKNDFVDALRFLFGGPVDQIEKLYNECLLPISLPGVLPFLEVYGIVDTRIGETIKFSRSISNNCMVYKVNGDEVKLNYYMTIINGMRSDGSFFISRHDFTDALFENKGIENVLSNFMGIDSKLNELQMAVKKHAVLEKAVNMEIEKHSIIKLKDQKEVNQLVDQFADILNLQECKRQRALENLMRFSQSRDAVATTSSSCSTSCEEMSVDFEVTLPRTQRSQSTPLWSEQEQIDELLPMLQLLEAQILGKIFYNQRKVLLYQEDISIIQEHIALKVKIEEKLNQIKDGLNEMRNELNCLDSELCLELAAVNDYKASQFRARLTGYGRLRDWIKPGQYYYIFEKVLRNLLNAHLVDTWESAIAFMNLLKDSTIQTRETFIVLSEYSTKLKDTLFENGEGGIIFTSLSDVMVLLCKFKQFHLIDDVPVIINQGSIGQDILGSNALFLETHEFTRKDGPFGRYDLLTNSDDRPIQDILQNANTLVKHQEMIFDSQRSQLAVFYKLKMDLAFLSEDARVLSCSTRTNPTTNNLHLSTHTHILPDQIYDEYSSIFKNHLDLLTASYMEEEAGIEEDQYNVMLEVDELKNCIISLKGELKNVQRNIDGVVNQQKAMADAYRNHIIDTLQLKIVVSQAFLIPEPETDKSLLALDMRMTELKKIITNEEAEELKGSEEWRDKVLDKLASDLQGAKMKLKECELYIITLYEHRTQEFAHFFLYCQDKLPKLFQLMIDSNVTAGEIGFYKEDAIQFSLGKDKNSMMDVTHNNVFVRLIAILALFLQMARYRKGMLLVLDDLEELVPRTDLDICSALAIEYLPHARFYTLERVGLAIKAFLNEIILESGDSPHGVELMNLEQIILLTSDDIAVATDAKLLIVKQLLKHPSGSGEVVPISQLISL